MQHRKTIHITGALYSREARWWCSPKHARWPSSLPFITALAANRDDCPIRKVSSVFASFCRVCFALSQRSRCLRCTSSFQPFVFHSPSAISRDGFLARAVCMGPRRASLLSCICRPSECDLILIAVAMSSSSEPRAAHLRPPLSARQSARDHAVQAGIHSLNLRLYVF